MEQLLGVPQPARRLRSRAGRGSARRDRLGFLRRRVGSRCHCHAPGARLPLLALRRHRPGGSKSFARGRAQQRGARPERVAHSPAVQVWTQTVPRVVPVLSWTLERRASPLRLPAGAGHRGGVSVPWCAGVPVPSDVATDWTSPLVEPTSSKCRCRSCRAASRLSKSPSATWSRARILKKSSPASSLQRPVPCVLLGSSWPSSPVFRPPSGSTRMASPRRGTADRRGTVARAAPDGRQLPGGRLGIDPLHLRSPGCAEPQRPVLPAGARHFAGVRPTGGRRAGLGGRPRRDAEPSDAGRGAAHALECPRRDRLDRGHGPAHRPSRPLGHRLRSSDRHRRRVADPSDASPVSTDIRTTSPPSSRAGSLPWGVARSRSM